MIASFSAHPRSGKYPYPLQRTEPDPYKEFAKVFCSNLTLAKLANGKVTADSKLLAQWATLQYFSSEDFKKTFVEFRPVLSPRPLEAGIEIQGVPVSPVKVTITIPAEECFKHVTAELLRGQGVLFEYFSLLESRMLIEDGHQFTLSKQLYSDVPLDQIFALKRGVEADAEIYWSMHPAVYNFHRPPQKWFRFMQWLEPQDLAKVDSLPLKEAYEYLAELAPAKEAFEAYHRLVARTFDELPRPTDCIAHAKQVMNLYATYLGGDFRLQEIPLCAVEARRAGISFWHILLSKPYRYGTALAGYSLSNYNPLPAGWDQISKRVPRKEFMQHCYLPGKKCEQNWVQPIEDVLQGLPGIPHEAHKEIIGRIASQ